MATVSGGGAPPRPAPVGGSDQLAVPDHPMAIVTVAADGVNAGCLVGFHTQCSMQPKRYLVCISVLNHTFDIAVRAPAAAVHFLARSDIQLARLFGEATGDEVDKFTRCQWAPGPFGVPVLDHDGSWVAGPVVDRWPLGDHHGVVIDAAVAGGRLTRPQLQFSDVTELEPGHPV